MNKELIQCPICLETLQAPIIQCQTGHSFCKSCIAQGITSCPTCRGPISPNGARNYQLEQLINSLKTLDLKAPCTFTAAGCKFELKSSELPSHERECRYRRIRCEGATYGIFVCSWVGSSAELLKHFGMFHQRHTVMHFKTEASLKLDLSKDFRDLQLVSWQDGAQYFYYKFRIDVELKKLFWTFQLLGTEKQAANFFYEFEVFDKGVRKIKFTEVATSDSTDIVETYKLEKCAIMSFAAAKSFMDERDEMTFRFRIMKKKNENFIPKKK